MRRSRNGDANHAERNIEVWAIRKSIATRKIARRMGGAERKMRIGVTHSAIAELAGILMGETSWVSIAYERKGYP
jgi:hypothetical protein